MADTDNLNLPLIAANQDQKHVTHNEAITALDAIVQLSVKDKDLATPPGSPSEGDRYIVAASATGDWAGEEGNVAAYQSGAWAFYTPQDGWFAWVDDESLFYVYGSSAWSNDAAGVTLSQLDDGTVETLGVNANADATNRLSVNSGAVLFNRETDDVQVKLNKQAAGDNASFLFQTNFSGRAEIGLAGNDDFSFKVSPDGSTFYDGILIDKDDGSVSFPNTVTREVLGANRTYYVSTAGSDSNDGLSSGGAFLTIQKALDVVFGTLDLGGYDVTIDVANGTYTGNISISSPQVGDGSILIDGDNTTPSNVYINVTGPDCIYLSGYGTKLKARGVKLKTTGFSCIRAVQGALFESAGKIEIESCGTGHQIMAEGNATIRLTHGINLVGGAPGWHLLASTGGFIYTQGASWTITGTPTLGGFAQAQTNGVIYTFSNSFTGSITGKRYSATLGGIIQTNSGGSATFYPGSSAGTTATGGQYS